jgi:polyhydroxybutyrate depolymerase
VFVPSSYDAATPTPLVILLHGFTASGDIQEAYFQLEPLAEERGFLYVHPDGTVGVLGNRFWNATPACCDFLRSGVDDSTYLTSIIDQVSATYNVDPKRIFFAGHSNGGFMSYRMACDHADRVAAIASLAGATFEDTAACNPSEPVSVMEVHGTADQTIEYTGGRYFGGTYPSAPQTVATWAGYDGCATTPTPRDDTADIDNSIPGNETTIETFDGCPAGIDVELWTIRDGPHIPAIVGDDGTRTLSEAMIDFLFAHPKP